jgi:hypothetical protein
MAPVRQVQEVSGWGGEFKTDARTALLHLSATGDPLSLVLIDATMASWSGRVEFSVGPLVAAADLHLDRTSLAELSHGTASAAVANVDRTLCAE